MIHSLAADVDAFTSNAFLVEGERTVLVDAGSNFDAVARVREQDADLDAVVLTHTHPDHVGNVQTVVEAFDVSVWGFDLDHDLVDHAIVDGETVQLGDDEYVALHTPGHKNDHLCFYAEQPEILFVGDLIFQGGSFGRYDLEEGDRALLTDSIDRVKETVDGSLSELHPGHGPSITEDAFRDVELAAHAVRSF